MGTGYRNEAEYLAIQIEGVAARELGEPVRENWRGKEIFAFNPTTSTIGDEVGARLWAQINELGVWEFGPLYELQGYTPQAYVPTFGSTDPSNYADTTTPPDGRWFPDDLAGLPPSTPPMGDLPGWPNFPNEPEYDWTLTDFPSEHDLDWTLSPLLANRTPEEFPELVSPTRPVLKLAIVTVEEQIILIGAPALVPSMEG